MGKDNGFFISPSFGRLSLESVIENIIVFMDEDREAAYKLVIGTDSKTKNFKKAKTIDLVTAVVIYRLGKGGRYFWRRERQGKMYSLRQKIYAETLLSLEVAKILVPLLRKKTNGNGKYELEIHIDVGNNGPTKEMIKEVVGIVQGNGYQAKTKPLAYGASSVADRHT